MNEMPVTDTSKKVRNVIRRRQQDGKWICSVPYGYVITNSKTMAFEVERTEAVIVQKVFELYNQGWGYKRIANYLTAQHIPTPRMNEHARKEARGEVMAVTHITQIYLIVKARHFCFKIPLTFKNIPFSANRWTLFFIVLYSNHRRR
jgi:hypothetical protein